MTQLPKLRNNKLPWYIFDDDNGILITSPTIPVSITDAKEIVWAEPAIPGLNYTPLYPNRNGNRTVAFQIPIINRKGKFGNSNLLQAFDILRNNDNPSLSALFDRGSTYKSNPSVIYQWGLHTTPLRWKIKRLDYTPNPFLTNPAGFSQYTIVDIELALDENSELYRMSRISRKVQAAVGVAQSVQSIFGSNGRAY